MAKKTEEEEWWEAFGYLSPEDQEATMAEMGYAPQQQASSEFGYYGGGLEDYPLEGISAMPEYTAAGNLDPRDMTQFNKGIDVAQNYGSLLLDNILTGLSGPGAYDTSAFTPEMEYGKEVTRPGNDRLQDYAQRGGWEGFLANEILKGGTPSSAMASLQAKLEAVDTEDPELSESERAALQSLTNSLPRNQDTEMRTPEQQKALGFWGDYDYDRLYDTANEYSDAVFKDDAYGWQDPETGRYYDTAPTEIKTPQMEFFDKYGLPYPTASYDDPKYLQAMLDAEEGTDQGYRQAEAQDYQSRYQGVTDQTRAAEQAQRGQGAQEQEMLKAWEDFQAQQTAPLGPKPERQTYLDAAMTRANASGEEPWQSRQTYLDRAMDRANASGEEPWQSRQTYLDRAMGRANLTPTAGRLQTSAQAQDRGASLEAANVAADLDYERATQGRSASVEAANTAADLDYERATEGRKASVEAANTAADIDFERAMEQWQAEQAERQMQPGAPWLRTAGAGAGGLLGSRRQARSGDQGFGSVLAPGATVADPAMALGSWFTGTGSQRRMKGEDVSPEARKKRADQSYDKMEKARIRQREVEAADPRLNDIAARTKLMMLARLGRTPLQDAVGQRRLGASRLGL